jgi:hypothetical protein
MPLLMTQGAVVQCPHQGLGTTIPTAPILTINGQIAVVEGDPGTLACPFLVYPCLGYTLRSMGLNATTIAGRRAILATDFQQSLTGLPLAIVETQTLVQDDSIPGSGAPPGDGTADGGLPPELLDLSAPVVTLAGPPALIFNSVTQLPATIPVVFMLASDHPLAWQLTLINPVLQQNLELTRGLIPGAVVAPAGGQWEVPLLTVTLTMSSVFMTALGLTTTAPHEIYMTGISQRGLSAYAKLALTVT